MLTTIAAVLAVLWLIGLIAGIGGSVIHLVLLIALAMFVYDMVMGRRSHV